jgi:hypothetical protein
MSISADRADSKQLNAAAGTISMTDAEVILQAANNNASESSLRRMLTDRGVGGARLGAALDQLRYYQNTEHGSDLGSIKNKFEQITTGKNLEDTSGSITRPAGFDSNRPVKDQVMEYQTYFNKIFKANGDDARFPALVEDGLVGPRTIAIAREAQKNGQIDGKTLSTFESLYKDYQDRGAKSVSSKAQPSGDDLSCSSETNAASNASAAQAVTTSPQTQVEQALTKERQLVSLKGERDVAQRGDGMNAPARGRLLKKLDGQIGGLEEELSANPAYAQIQAQRGDQEKLSAMQDKVHLLPSDEEKAQIAEQQKTLSDAIAQRKATLGEIPEAPRAANEVVPFATPSPETKTPQQVLRAEKDLKALQDELTTAKFSGVRYDTSTTVRDGMAAKTRLTNKIQSQIDSMQSALDASPIYAQIQAQRADLKALQDLGRNDGAWIQTGRSIAANAERRAALENAIAERQRMIGDISIQ